MKVYIPTGNWPIRYDLNCRFIKKMGYTIGDENSDILFLPGGSDIGDRLNRDEAEFTLYQKWTAEGRPVVGVCRGMQVMLHLNGATLIPHIPDVQEDVIHTTINGHWQGQSSWHQTTAGLFVNSRHHQGFLEVPADWQVLDSAADGIVEAVCRGNQFAVQWHPEHPEIINTAAVEWWSETLKSIL
jgi:gamma-glutamyl-gamma-aminobutyrate hydrolase PuuD